MNGKTKRIVDYLHQPPERKKVTDMLKAGKIKKISGPMVHNLNTKRNRIITIVLAFILFLTGLLSVIF